jgi:aspartate/methionine/tyrosine aminotransferase
MTNRIQEIKESGIRKIFDKAATLKNVINMSIGQPDYSVPKEIKNSIINAINEDKTGYTPSIGISELRKEVMLKHGFKDIKDNGFTSIITSGTTAGIFLSYSALINEGDEIIIFDPYFLVYPEISKFLGIKPKIVETNLDFSINFKNLKQSINLKTKAIMVNSPSNPSGYIIKKDEVKN